MEKNKIGNIPFKISLSFSSLLLGLKENKHNKYQYNNDPFLKLKLNYEEIENISKLKKPNIYQYFYFNREQIKNILYNSNKVILFDILGTKKSLSYYFYLNLLINYNDDLIDYSCSNDFIKEINILSDGVQKDEKYKKIILSKVIIDLIKNYKERNSLDEENELNKIEIINGNNIKANISIFKEISIKINNIFEIKIDEIYIEIILGLIKNKKLEDYKFSFNIIEQLEFENINVTDTMFNKIFQILNSNKSYIKDYIIEKLDDLYDSKKINFYYILLKYILKYSYYIYKIPILFKIRKLILNLLKAKKIIFDIDEKLTDKFKFILKTFSDSDYYIQYLLNLDDISKLKEILKYYKDFLFESKKEEIEQINDIINKNNKIINKEYLKDYHKSIEINVRAPIINYLYNKKNKEKNEKELNKYIEKWKVYENLIEQNKINEIIEEDGLLLKEFFDNNNNIFMTIFNKKYENNFNITSDNTKATKIESSENKNYLNISSYNKNQSYSNLLKQVHNSEVYYAEKNNFYSNLENNPKLDINKKVSDFESHKEDLKSVILKLKNYRIIAKNGEEMQKLENFILNYENIKKDLDNFKDKKEEDEDYKILCKKYNGLIKFIQDLEDLAIKINKNYHDNVEYDLSFEEKSDNFDCLYKIKINDIENNLDNNKIINILNNNNINLFEKPKIFSNSLSIIASQKSMTFSSNKSFKDFLSNLPNSRVFLRKIEHHIDSAIYVIELSNGYIISGGPENFIYYNNNYVRIKSDMLKHNIIREEKYEKKDIKEVKSEKKDIELIICSKDDFSFKKIPKKDINQIISEPNNKDDTDKNKSDYLNFIILKTNSYMICKNDGLYIIDNLRSNIVQKRENKINNLGDESFIGAIRINDQYSAFTSYKTLLNGNEKIVFFNCNSKKIIREIEDDYEFIKSPNNMTLIKREEVKEKTKILLCACKKSKKNGILLIQYLFFQILLLLYLFFHIFLLL